MKRIAIMGFYGYDNTGDELILGGIIAALRRVMPEVELTVFSANPEQTASRFGVHSVFAGRRFAGLGDVFRVLRRSDLFILGGGGLLQDREKRIVPYWISRVALAKLAGCKIMFYGQGVGPLATTRGQRLSRWGGNLANYITVRDVASATLMKQIGVRKTPIEVVADPALSLTSYNEEARAQAILEREGVNLKGRSVLTVSLREWPEMNDKWDLMAAKLDGLIDTLNCIVLFVPMQIPVDIVVAKKVQRKMQNHEHAIVLQSITDPLDSAAILSVGQVLIGMRLHSLLASAAQGVPFVGLDYDPKVAAWARRLDLPAVSLGNLHSDFLLLATKELWDNQKNHSSKIKKKIQVLQVLADRGAHIAQSLIEG